MEKLELQMPVSQQSNANEMFVCKWFSDSSFVQYVKVHNLPSPPLPPKDKTKCDVITRE